ncbi:hypothetical protein [Devosia sp. LC5]|uniref:hypothetical protein n=1 Tax=Devosia sp. LC5 TaxID=1502724 RepID=UPI0012682648|nr:hypothetical protein [Devosia sp. LC5]
MVAADYHIVDLRERASQKQALRDIDAQRVVEGRASPRQIRRENHVLGNIDMSSFRMVSIGRRAIGAR